MEDTETDFPASYVTLIGTCVSLAVVPDVVGMTEADAETAIVAAELVLGVSTYAWDAVIPAGDVISQDPVGGTSVPPGSAVDIHVSRGPQPANCMPTDGNYPTQITSFDDYVSKKWDPSCWCASGSGGSGYQCHGDADGTVSAFPNFFRVYLGDLNIVAKNWKQKRVDYPGALSSGDADNNPLPCGDIDHKLSAFPNYFAVYLDDLNRIALNWKAKNADFTPDGANCPLTDVVNNATYVDPTPGVPP
jgi:hypothetical protein